MNNKMKSRMHICLNSKNLVVGFVMLLSVIIVAVFATQIANFDYTDQTAGAQFLAPNTVNWFGTDELGRDVFSRVVYGTRMSLWIALLGASIELVIGVVVGLLCGYFGGKIDSVFSFLTDITWCIPGTILALAVITVIGRSLTNSAIAIALVGWASYARPVRARTMSIRTMAFVETGKVFGESSATLMFRYILPNIMPTLIVMVSMSLPSIILATSTLSFLGMGSQPPSPDWALALSDGISYIGRAPWMTIFPGLALVYTVLGFSLFGEGLRDVIDPFLKSR